MSSTFRRLFSARPTIDSRILGERRCSAISERDSKSGVIRLWITRSLDPEAARAATASLASRSSSAATIRSAA